MRRCTIKPVPGGKGGGGGAHVTGMWCTWPGPEGPSGPSRSGMRSSRGQWEVKPQYNHLGGALLHWCKTSLSVCRHQPSKTWA